MRMLDAADQIIGDRDALRGRRAGSNGYPPGLPPAAASTSTILGSALRRQPCPAASWTSCTRDAMPSFV